MSQGPTQWHLELESEIVRLIQENWLPHVFWDLLETVEAVQTPPSVFTRGNGPHDFLKFHVLFGREPWTHKEGTLRKELAYGAHTIHGVTWVADEVVF